MDIGCLPGGASFVDGTGTAGACPAGAIFLRRRHLLFPAERAKDSAFRKRLATFDASAHNAFLLMKSVLEIGVIRFSEAQFQELNIAFLFIRMIDIPLVA